MPGDGCNTCPVKDCDTMIYRGSRCAALRHKAGTYMDPMTIREWILSMNAAQMAEFFASSEVFSCEICNGTEAPMGCDGRCADHCMGWLMTPLDPGVEVSS